MESSGGASLLTAEGKVQFTAALILTVPDPQWQFVVEVDASNVGIGAILSQKSAKDNKLHPCAFFSRKLTPAEKNYDISNKELLVVKVALEEWRHWLEGAEQPFLVWTDHKNLEYLIKRLNSRQARWSLFFNRFNFSLSYRPRSQNTKPDALSCMTPSLLPRNLNISYHLGGVTWQIESEVKSANGVSLVPSGCPQNRLFVPVSLRPQVIHLAHTLVLTCHLGEETADVMMNHVFRLHEFPRDIVSDFYWSIPSVQCG